MDNNGLNFGLNLGYVMELYERYRQDPETVDIQTRKFFKTWTPPTTDAVSRQLHIFEDGSLEKFFHVSMLVEAIRSYGYLGAKLDPLRSEPPGDPRLDWSFHNLSKEDLVNLPASFTSITFEDNPPNAYEAIKRLEHIYFDAIGYDFGHISSPEERMWLQRATEDGVFRSPERYVDLLAILKRLTQIEVFEHFLHRIFPGKTRFSIEGLDLLIPMLDEIVREAAEADLCMVFLGMAHRGRINVLAHVLNKPYAQILAEFKDPGMNLTTSNELGWTGDVKYHKGAHRALNDDETLRVVIAMPPNPSHLEHIDPVLMGMARAAGSLTKQPGTPEFSPQASLPVLIHGDASFPAQGIVAETLNLSQISGYTIGGTIHIIANNQIGFTTTPREGRSTYYASDLAKGFDIPIMHVNADDPEACLEAARTAFAYRHKFAKDFVINLIGYRRYGHNEGDEPGFTQPLLYRKIQDHPSARKSLADRLIDEGVCTQEDVDRMVRDHMNHLQEELESLEPKEEILEPQLEPPPQGAARRVKTGVNIDKLRKINQTLLELPESFKLHRKIEKFFERRKDLFDDANRPVIDWATAEQLSLATILADGISIRFTGEDTARGTFSHRHTVFHDVQTGKTWTPLQSFPQAKASFEIINSPLSENAALAYEVGYNIQSSDSLVIWEAQYGDFINAAQVIVDEFIVSARAKWELTPSLVLLLPHGYEGQGPDHSTGRVERILQLAAQTNIRIANCTTAAQYFHLLRRQAALLKTDPLPLVIMSPKSLLRHPQTFSTPRELDQGSWRPVLDDERAREKPDEIHRLILCSGKIYIDLVSSDSYEVQKDVAIVRLEQLYRFPKPDLEEILEGYPKLKEVVWVQEEPMNMGAWTFVQPLLTEIIGERWPLRYVGRISNASPAEGSSAWHNVNQTAIIKQAYELHKDIYQDASLIVRD